MNELDVVSKLPTYQNFEQEALEVNRLIGQQIAKGTKRVYLSDWQIFSEWCSERQFHAADCTPEAVSLFLASQFERGFHPSTLSRRLAAIKFAYTCRNLPSPTEDALVRATLKGIRRDEKAPPQKHKKPATSDKLIQMLQLIPDSTLRGIRDRAILLIGFGGAFRRSELVKIMFDDIEFHPGKGVDVKLYHSKTNQEGQLERVSISEGERHCPIRALKTWLAIAQVTSGYVFRALTRSDRVTHKPMCVNTFYYLVKQYATLAGYTFDHFSPHSLRAGFATSATEAGKHPIKTMEVTRHKSFQSFKPYIRLAERYKDHAGKGLL